VRLLQPNNRPRQSRNRKGQPLSIPFKTSLSPHEGAGLRGLRTNAVKVALHRALARLRLPLLDEPAVLAEARLQQRAVAR
jgi:hypothetical protein